MPLGFGALTEFALTEHPEPGPVLRPPSAALVALNQPSAWPYVFMGGQQPYAPHLLPIGGITPITPTEPPPGHGDWPRHLKKKPVRPIWDRRPDPLPHEEHEEPALARQIAPDVAPKLPELGIGPPILARQIAPLDLPPEPVKAPARKKYQRRTSAKATLVEIEDLAASAFVSEPNRAHGGLRELDDGVSAQSSVRVDATALISERSDKSINRSIVRIELREDAEQVFARAEWSDDDIALMLLLN